ncbi:MAG: hypothetical protein WCF10_11570 [Polyangiales bacterium]
MRGSVKWVALCGAVLTTSAANVGCTTTCVNGYYNNYCTTYGYYYDSPVSGLSYKSSGKAGVQTGVTGEDSEQGPGSFRYVDEDTVSFSLGDTVLGESQAQERITPFDLAGLAASAVGGCDVSSALPDETPFRRVSNLAVLLQSLDTDGDPTNGIDISADVAALFDGVNIDLSQAWEAFQADTDLQTVLDNAKSGNLLPATRVLRERVDALRALYEGTGLCP